MILITLSPVRVGEPEPVFIKSGDTISINGESFDFSRMESGDMLPVAAISSDYFHGDFVYRVGDDLHMTLKFPYPEKHGKNQSFPKPIKMVADGRVPLPQAPEDCTDPVDDLPIFEAVEGDDNE